MGLFNFGKSKLNLIEFTDDNSTLLKINNVGEADVKNTEMIVPSTHFCFVVADGVISDLLDPGRHPLVKIAKGSRSVKIIYISKTAKVETRWGTPPQMRIKYTDPKIGMPIDVGAFGRMEFKVSDPKQFYLEIVANFGDSFTLDELSNRIRTKLVDRVSSSVRKLIQSNELSYYDFDNKKDDMQFTLKEELGEVFVSSVGLTVTDFLIENLNVTEENEKKIREKYQKAQDEVEHDEDRAIERKREQERREDARSQREWEVEQDNWKKSDIDRDLRFERAIAENEEYVYNRDKAREREQEEYDRRNRIEDETRRHEWESEDKDREANIAAAALKYEAVKEAGWEADQQQPQQPQQMPQEMPSEVPTGSIGRHCRMCGAAYEPTDKFCPACGNPTDNNNQEITCPSCHKSVSVKNKFCPSCGAKLHD